MCVDMCVFLDVCVDVCVCKIIVMRVARTTFINVAVGKRSDIYNSKF